MEAPDLQHLPVSMRNLHQGPIHNIHQDSIVSQLDEEFDPSDPNSYQPYSSIGSTQVNGNVFDVASQSRARLHNGQANGQLRTPVRQQTSNGTSYPAHSDAQYGMITPDQQISNQPIHSSIGRLQQENGFLETPDQGGREESTHFGGMKLIENPPSLEEWRERLFNVDETITLTEQEFQTYFPHVDNVYSHRSTQKYKRKPFISHYWDCRLKGRPPGTPKSDDPNKKKRKRTARERDLCDVKIKITEYFPGGTPATDFGPGIDPMPVDLASATNFFAADAQNTNNVTNGTEAHTFGVLTPSTTNLPVGHPGASGGKYYTIQRVNGNGGNGKADSGGGPHKHTLEESDRVKKNSVQRWLLKGAKDKKKNQQQQVTTATKSQVNLKRVTGLAALTAKRHVKEADITLFGNCVCPFVQRIWIALEIKGIPYQYVETDQSKKPAGLLEVSPRGMVPAIKHGNWGTFDSMVIMEYLEDLSIGHALLPLGDPQLRAHCRQWVDYINRHVLPSFYTLLQSNDPPTHSTLTATLQDHITALVNSSHVTGPFFLGPQISYVDIAFAPWILRLSRVLKYYRGWPDPEVGSRWETWVDAVERDERVRNTLSDDEMYRDKYEGIAENRPGIWALNELVNSLGKAGLCATLPGLTVT